MSESFTALVVILVVILIYCIHKFSNSSVKRRDLKGRHVIVTGGSSGIGKSAAVEASRLGAHVTIIGRNVEKLTEALAEVKACAIDNVQHFNILPFDVTEDFDKIQAIFNDIENKVGPVYMLINCAGQAICGILENVAPEDVKYQMYLNYFGSVFTTKIVLPGMKKRDEGIIVFVSSQAALLGIYGLSSYCASKWAVRGLAEALMMETVGTGISVTIGYPPDTDTPGFHIEEQSKPPETKLICQSSGLISPNVVARHLIIDALDGKPYSVVGLEGWMMSMLTGITFQGISHLLLQSILMGPLRIVLACYLISFHRIIIKYKGSNRN